ncbi:MAG: hypothetical protein AABZ44_02875 [Elusimicrobiota bacterium]
MEQKVLGRIGHQALSPFYPRFESVARYLTFPVSGRAMGDLLRRGRIFAGPVAPLEYFRLLKAGCEPLHDYGLFVNPYIYENMDTTHAGGAMAALVQAPYVLMMSGPVHRSKYVRVGVSEDIFHGCPDAMLLAQLLLTLYWEVPHSLGTDPDGEYDALLCEGGPTMRSRIRWAKGLGYAYDLALEWYRWRKTPYAFYRWVSQPDVSNLGRKELTRDLNLTLELNLRNLPSLALEHANMLDCQRHDSLAYYQSFGYRLDLWAENSEAQLGGMIELLKNSELAFMDSGSGVNL